jgi:phospholipase A2
VILSGGGNRAMFSSCGFVQGLQEIGILDATTYIAALSGSTWFLGSWYASNLPQVADFRKKFAQTMTRGITTVTPQEFNLMLDAFKIKYVYHEPITSMDLFGALLGNALLNDFGDNRYHVSLSDQKNNIVAGDWPFPIYTAIDGSNITHRLDRWYEFTPYEIGGAWLNHYIPTWAFGRRFAQGVSSDDAPEVGLAFLFGLFGSAFSVDVHRAWIEIEKAVSVHKKIQTMVETNILNQIGAKRITQCEEFNFTAGMPTSQLRDQKYMIFVDAGFASGLPYPPVSGERPERTPDILIFFEVSDQVSKIKKDVKAATTGLHKAATYAHAHGLKFPTIFSVEPTMVTVYKDDRNPETPVVIWMPCMREQERWATLNAIDQRFAAIQDFDLADCINNFCSSPNFTYSVAQAEQLITLGQFCAHACQHEIIEAIAWKMEHMTP